MLYPFGNRMGMPRVRSRYNLLKDGGKMTKSCLILIIAIIFAFALFAGCTSNHTDVLPTPTYVEPKDSQVILILGSYCNSMPGALNKGIVKITNIDHESHTVRLVMNAYDSNGLKIETKDGIFKIYNGVTKWVEIPTNIIADSCNFYIDDTYKPE